MTTTDTTKPQTFGDRLIESLQEARAFIEGTGPAASFTINGYTYVLSTEQDPEVLDELRRLAEAETAMSQFGFSDLVDGESIAALCRALRYLEGATEKFVTCIEGLKPIMLEAERLRQKQVETSQSLVEYFVAVVEPGEAGSRVAAMNGAKALFDSHMTDQTIDRLVELLKRCRPTAPETLAG